MKKRDQMNTTKMGGSGSRKVMMWELFPLPKVPWVCKLRPKFADETTITSKSATPDDAFQIDQNNNANIVEVDVSILRAGLLDRNGEVVSDNDEFERNAYDDGEDCGDENDELTSSSNNSSEK
ncbi:hypothetical protein Syun_012672 [Stephania yunnanensis]|uniref:Uncharacterized protein n=1 Tax=Stephania yunnanensis TaxID=152371 RepID=A0AAP0PGL4_9MAGN